jgi:streptogramin lyase
VGAEGSANGTGSAARFDVPAGVALDSAGNVYVADVSNNTIRKVTPAGVVTTLAGQPQFENGDAIGGSADGTNGVARFNFPNSVAVDSAGNLYVADGFNYLIRKGFPASSVPAPILQPPSLSAGRFVFGITGLPGLAVEIESSGDFSSWQVVGEPILEGGTNYFVNPSPSQGAMFYRAQVR